MVQPIDTIVLVPQTKSKILKKIHYKTFMQLKIGKNDSRKKIKLPRQLVNACAFYYSFPHISEFLQRH